MYIHVCTCYTCICTCNYGTCYYSCSLTGETTLSNEVSLSHAGPRTGDKLQSLDEWREKRLRQRALSSEKTPPIRVEITPRKSSMVATTAASADVGRPRSLSQGEHSLNCSSVVSGSGREMEPNRHGIRPRSMAEWESYQQRIHSIEEKPEGKVKDENEVETGITGDKGPL